MSPTRIETVVCPRCGEVDEIPVFILRCYVRPARDGYVAECVDLDLFAEADDLPEARRRLQDAICGYLDIAYERQEPFDLLPRPSPLVNRLRYHWWRAAFAVFRGFVRRVEAYKVLGSARRLVGQPAH